MAEKKESTERELVKAVQKFPVERQIAIRQADKQYNIWRSEGRQDWAVQWKKYFYFLCDPRNRDWHAMEAPRNDHNENFWKSEYRRPSRYQGLNCSSAPNDLASRLESEYYEQSKTKEQRRNEHNSYLMARLQKIEAMN